MSMLARDVHSGEARTKQSMRDEVDINRIVGRARRVQAVTHLARGVPSYMDVSDVGDYKGALDMIRSMDAYFERLPAKLRAEFRNDPALFLDEMETDDGRAKLERAGIIPARVVPVVPVLDGVAESATP